MVMYDQLHKAVIFKPDNPHEPIVVAKTEVEMQWQHEVLVCAAHRFEMIAPCHKGAEIFKIIAAVSKEIPSRAKIIKILRDIYPDTLSIKDGMLLVNIFEYIRDFKVSP